MLLERCELGIWRGYPASSAVFRSLSWHVWHSTWHNRMFSWGRICLGCSWSCHWWTLHLAQLWADRTLLQHDFFLVNMKTQAHALCTSSWWLVRKIFVFLQSWNLQEPWVKLCFFWLFVTASPLLPPVCPSWKLLLLCQISECFADTFFKMCRWEFLFSSVNGVKGRVRSKITLFIEECSSLQ